MSHHYLIIGGTGKTGSRVAQRLEAAGMQVRATSRSSTPRFDWEDESSWPAAIEGMDAAYITYAPDIALPGAVARVERFVALALAAGLKRLVLLTGRGEEEAQKAEDVLKRSGADWTIVRASWFAQNFSEGFFADEIRHGQLHFPRLDVPEPFIDVEDIADVAAAALLDRRHVGALYEVTGPDLLTFREAIAEISAATGRPVATVAIPVSDYIDGLRASGIPAPYVELIEILTTEVFDGRNASTADGVAQALGRPARRFSDYVAAAAKAGAWPVTETK